ncbi:hypothetical protein ABT352_39125 [Streptosporangium sp. NPDC000563]|uniref:hypothetical protein n=1 Tax=Streptosporangium sp. NPDC000563 TaxID=3154366 RepID=UPI00332BF731
MDGTTTDSTPHTTPAPEACPPWCTAQHATAHLRRFGFIDTPDGGLIAVEVAQPVAAADPPAVLVTIVDNEQPDLTLSPSQARGVASALAALQSCPIVEHTRFPEDSLEETAALSAAAVADFTAALDAAADFIDTLTTG